MLLSEGQAGIQVFFSSLGSVMLHFVIPTLLTTGKP